jgi:hypothetical protein
MGTTEWYPPEIKPVHVGWFEAAIFDAGWALFNQHQTWRGMTTEQTT